MAGLAVDPALAPGSGLSSMCVSHAPQIAAFLFRFGSGVQLPDLAGTGWPPFHPDPAVSSAPVPPAKRSKFVPRSPNLVRSTLTSTSGTQRPITREYSNARTQFTTQIPAREQVPLTQAELAERVGVAELPVRRWETEGLRPQPAHVRSLCSALDVTPAEFGYGTDDPTPTEPAPDTPLDEPPRLFVLDARTLLAA